MHRATSYTLRRCEKITGESVIPSPDTMAFIYERVPLYKVVKAWDNNNPNLSECYKLQSNDLQNKSHIEIHKDNGKYGIVFTIEKTIPQFSKVAEKCDLTWSDSFVEFENVLQGYHRTAWKQVLHGTFQSPSMQRCQCQLRRIATWKKTSIECFSSLFSKC